MFEETNRGPPNLQSYFQNCYEKQNDQRKRITSATNKTLYVKPPRVVYKASVEGELGSSQSLEKLLYLGGGCSAYSCRLFGCLLPLETLETLETKTHL